MIKRIWNTLFKDKERFISLPAIGKKNKSSKQRQSCEEKIQKAEDIGIPVEKYCPECIGAGEKEQFDTVFYCREMDIKNFFPLTENETQIEFYDDSFGIYELSLEELLEKLK